MLSGLITLLLSCYDYLVWGVLGLPTIEVVEKVTDFIYLLEGLGL